MATVKLNMHTIKPIILIITLLGCVAGAQPYSKLKHLDEVENNMRTHLAGLTEPADSLPTLLNLFDIEQALGERNVYDSLSTQIFHTAIRAGKTSVALEMLRHKVNLASNNGLKLREIIGETERFEGHPDYDVTRTMAAMMLNRYYMNSSFSDTTQVRFQEQLHELTVSPPSDIYDKIVLLHSVCMHLAKEKSREMLPVYFEKLTALVDSVNDPTHALHSALYLHSALAYMEAGLTEESFKSDSKLIALMDTLDAYYELKGRPYRDYGNSKYSAYRRMMGNWRNMSRDELEDTYATVKELLKGAPLARRADSVNPVVDIYYYMGTGNYPAAKQLLEKAIDNPSNSQRRSEFLRDVILAAKETGDKDTFIKYSDEYIDYLHSILQHRMQERYKELQVAYDLNEFKSEINSLRGEKAQTRDRFQRTIIWISLGALLALLILLFFLIRQYYHSKKLAGNLAQMNEALLRESNSLRKSKAELTEMRDEAQRANQFKTSFLKNLGREISGPLNAMVEHSRLIVDCADAANKPYLAQYADMIQFNGDYITTVINDVLHLSQLDSNSLSTSRSLVDLRKIAELVADTISNEVKDSVKIVFDPESINPLVFTDPQRVQQILMQLLSNAAKFTQSGTITLQCNTVNQGKMIAISVTDTGIGIAPEHKDAIFERFFKASSESTGAGLGLPLARMLARLLGGDLTLDANYRKGARFVFTIPNVTK